MKFIIFSIFLGFIYGQPEPIYQYSLPEATVYELPYISPDNDFLTIIASKEFQGEYLVLCLLEYPDSLPKPLFKLNKKKNKGKKKKSGAKSNESIIGWMKYNDTQILYTAIDKKIKGSDATQIFYHVFGEEIHVIKDLTTFDPNKKDLSIMINTDIGLMISFINSPYGYYHYSFTGEGTLNTQPNFFKLPAHVNSFSRWENNNTLLILEGRETIYHLWTASISNNWDPVSIKTDLSNYTIVLDAHCKPNSGDIFSFCGSTAEMIDESAAELCIYDLGKNKVIDKINIYVSKQYFPGTKFSQWSKQHNRIYFLRQNDQEQNKLYYYDMETGLVVRSSISDQNINIKAFKISDQGDIVALILYPTGRHVRVYNLDE